MTRLAFVDTETTGLDPDRHEIWEVGLIVRDEDGVESEYAWHLPVDLARADQIALNIGRFHDRYTGFSGTAAVRIVLPVPDPVERKDGTTRPGDPFTSMAFWAAEFVRLTRGAHLVGAVVSFDAERLAKLLRANGQCPMWHYHLIDVEALAVGYLAGRYRDESYAAPDDTGDIYQPPWDSHLLTEALNITIDAESKHTGLGDARWARSIYDAVMAPVA